MSASVSWKRRVAPLLNLLGVAAAAIALWSAEGLADAVRDIGAPAIAAAAALVAVGYTFAISGWRAVLWLLGIREVWAEAFAQLAVVQSGKYLPGKMAGVAGRVFAMRERILPAQVLTATLLEQLAALVASAACGVVLWLAGRHSLYMLLLLPLGWALIAAMLQAYPVVLSIVSRYLPKFGRRYIAGAAHAPTWRDGWRVSGAFGMQWVTYAIAIAVLCLAAKPGMGFGDAMMLAGAYAIATSLGALIVILPAGLGAREGLFVMLAAQVLGTLPALGLALVLRLVFSAVDMTAGVLAMLIVKRYEVRGV